MRRYAMSAVIAAAVAIGVTAAISAASVPDASTGVIHGCYAPTAAKQSGGPLAVIDGATQECASGATSLNWSQGPALVAYGEGSAGCAYEKGTTIYCGGGEGLVFTPSVDAVCRVSMDGGIISNGGEPDAKLTYGLADHTSSGNHVFGETLLSTTTGSFNTDKAATLARTSNLVVEAGIEYALKDQFSNISSSGTAYVNETYVCIASGK